VAYYRKRFTDKSSETLEGRVSAVETAVEHIESSMMDIRDSIRDGFSELKSEISTQEELARPKIVAWAGWAAVILLVLGMFGSGYIRDLERVENNQTVALTDVYKHRLEDATTEATQNERLFALERSVFIKEVIVNGGAKRKNK